MLSITIFKMLWFLYMTEHTFVFDDGAKTTAGAHEPCDLATQSATKNFLAKHVSLLTSYNQFCF